MKTMIKVTAAALALTVAGATGAMAGKTTTPNTVTPPVAGPVSLSTLTPPPPAPSPAPPPSPYPLISSEYVGWVLNQY